MMVDSSPLPPLAEGNPARAAIEPLLSAPAHPLVPPMPASPVVGLPPVAGAPPSGSPGYPGVSPGQFSSTTPLQLSSMWLPQISGAPGCTAGLVSSQSLHHGTPS